MELFSLSSACTECLSTHSMHQRRLRRRRDLCEQDPTMEACSWIVGDCNREFTREWSCFHDHAFTLVTAIQYSNCSLTGSRAEPLSLRLVNTANQFAISVYRSLRGTTRRVNSQTLPVAPSRLRSRCSAWRPRSPRLRLASSSWYCKSTYSPLDVVGGVTNSLCRISPFRNMLSFTEFSIPIALPHSCRQHPSDANHLTPTYASTA